MQTRPWRPLGHAHPAHLRSFLRGLPAWHLLGPLDEPQLCSIYECLDRGLLEEAQDQCEHLAGDSSKEALSFLVLLDILRAWGDSLGATALAREAPFAAGTREEAAAALAASYCTLMAGAREGNVTLQKEVEKVQDMLFSLSSSSPVPSLAQGAAFMIAAEANMATGSLAAAAQAAKRAVSCYRSIDDAKGQAAALRCLALASLGSQRLAEAAQSAKLAATRARFVGDVLGEGCALRLASEAELRQGDTQQAATLAQDSAALFQIKGDTFNQADALLSAAAALCLRAQQRKANAQRSSLESWAFQASALADKVLTMQCQGTLEVDALLARSWAATVVGPSAGPGQSEQALEDAQKAERLAIDISDRRRVAAARVARAQALVVQSEDALALDMLNEAHSLFQRAGDADGARFAATYMSGAGGGGASKASSKPEDHVYAGCATWEGLAKQPDQWWADHIHFQFAGLQGRPVANTVKRK
ncbi:unnamed protein product [Symbiodinium sp. CCMP2592]|nr:unnamed protein product [Symbiodinium sp. CCMP2592]